MTTNDIVIHDGSRTASLLADKLNEHDLIDAVIIAVPDSGITVAYQLSKLLGLPLDILPCRKMLHPADSRKSIASVTLDEIVTHHEPFDMPQDYRYHQIALMRCSLRAQWEFYKGNNPRVPLTGKTAMLVDDNVHDADSMIASVRSIKKQTPKKLVVAVRSIAPEAMFVLLHESVEVVSLHLQTSRHLHQDHAEDLPPEIDEALKEVLLNASSRF